MQQPDFLKAVLPQEGVFYLWSKAGGNVRCNSFDDLLVEAEAHNGQSDIYFSTASFRHGTPTRGGEHVLAKRCFYVDLDVGKGGANSYTTLNEAVADLNRAFNEGLPKPTLVAKSGIGLHGYWVLTEDVSPQEWQQTANIQKAALTKLNVKQDPVVTADVARVLRLPGTIHSKTGSTVSVVSIGKSRYTNLELREQLLELIPEDERFALLAPPVEYDDSVNKDVEFKGPPTSLAKVADHCAAIGKVRDTKGLVPEPVWRGMMGVAKYCEDGQELIHEYSKGDTRYSKRETQSKFDRWTSPPTTCGYFEQNCPDLCSGCKYKGKITTPKQLGYLATPEPQPEEIPLSPPPTVQPVADLPTVSSTDSESLAWTESAVVDDTPNCPLPGKEYLFDPNEKFFYREANGRWVLYVNDRIEVKDVTGSKVWADVVNPVAHRLAFIDSATKPGVTRDGHAVTIVGIMDNPKSTTYEKYHLDSGATSAADTLKKFMHGHGVFLDPMNKNAAAQFQAFFTKLLIREQNNMRYVVRERFGYDYYQGELICCQGEYAVFPTGAPGGEIQKVIVANDRKAISDALTSTCLPHNQNGAWDGSVWRSHVGPAFVQYISFLRKHYGKPGFEVARLALALGLASPLMIFATDTPLTEDMIIPSSGLVVSLFSNGSGRGKTSLQQTLAVAFGQSSQVRAGAQTALTNNAGNDIAYANCIYPFILDEVTRNAAEDVAVMVDVFSNGQGRVRSLRNGKAGHAMKTWALVTLVSTNTPQREMIQLARKSSDALHLRLIELDFDRVPKNNDNEAFTKDFGNLSKARGAFGLMLAQRIVNLGLERVNTMVKDNVTAAYRMLEIPQDYRFYARAFGALKTVRDLLGDFYPFDLDELVRTFKAALRGVDTTTNTPTEYPDIDAFLSIHSPYIAVTNTWGNKLSGQVNPQLNPLFRLPMVGREVRDRHEVVIDVAAIKRWCAEQSISVNAFLAKCKADGRMVGDTYKRVRMGTGMVGIPSITPYAYTFKTRNINVVSESKPASDDEEGTGT